MESKECTGCHIVKSLSEYSLIKRSGKLYTKCKQCVREQRKKWKEKNPDYHKKWRDENRERVRTYYHTPNVVAQREKYQKSPDGRLKRYLAKKARYHLPENEMKHNARAAIRRAIKKGILPKVNTLMCSNCKVNQAEHYHHHNGYDKEHRIDVIPVCQKCHLILDGFIKE